MKFKNLILYFSSLIIFFLSCTTPLTVPSELVTRLMPAPAMVNYKGSGILHAYIVPGDTKLSGSNIAYNLPFNSRILEKKRTLLVYTPPGYDETKLYPVLYCFHGYTDRPFSWVEHLLPILDQAIIAGKIQPFVLVMPDATLSGNGRNLPETKYDDRLGTWYIDSNVCRYESHFFEEIVPFVRSQYSISKDPAKTFIIGFSMGGFGGLYYSLKYTSMFQNVIALCGAFDLLYSINGNKMLPYESQFYKPITTDDPDRIVFLFFQPKVLVLTEAFLFYPVFDSDKINGITWKSDLPVWQRLKAVNPVDFLNVNKTDISNNKYYIVTGNQDNFNFNEHLKVVIPYLKAANASVFPENPYIPGASHSWEPFDDQYPLIFEWIKDCLNNRQISN